MIDLLVVELEGNLVISFIDLEKSFESISHAFLEEVLIDVSASNKSLTTFEQEPDTKYMVGADGKIVTSRVHRESTRLAEEYCKVI